MQKIMPCLWFDANAEEAVNFYTSLFENSKILSISRYGDAGPDPGEASWLRNSSSRGRSSWP